MHAAKRDNVRELFGGGAGPALSSPSHAQAQRAQYAAELRAQIEAKEAARNAERAHSLRQSVALLELRRRAGNAVLPERPVAAPPSAGGAASGMGCTDMQRGGQLQEAGHGGWAGEAPPPAHHQRQAAPWQGSEQRAADPQAAWSPPYALLPPAPAPGWAEPEARWGWSDAPASAEQPLYRTRLLPQGYPPSAGPAMPSDGFHSAAPVQPSQLLVQAPWGTGLPLPPLQPQPFQAAAARAPFGTDLSAPPPQLARSSSLRMQLQSSHAAGGGLLPWADVPTCTPHKGCCGGGASRLAPIGGGELEGQAVREALAQRRAAYKADLEAQMRLKQELQRQEREQDRQYDARKSRAAQALAQRAAAGGYGGGSGPLRDGQGRIVADLNQVRRHQANSAAGSPTSGAGTIAAHWKGSDGVGARCPPSDYEGDGQQCSMPAHLLPAPPGWQGSSDPGAAASPPPPRPTADATAAQAPLLSAHSGGDGGGCEQVVLRPRSDRPYQTASEAERRRGAQAEFQEALRRQVEDKARAKAEEQQRRRAEEAEEEARLERERQRLREQYAADQARQRTKQAEKEEGGNHESGGISIKFKPKQTVQQRQHQGEHEAPPAQQQQQQAFHGAAVGALSQDEAVPGVEIRVPRHPPAQMRAGAVEEEPAASAPREETPAPSADHAQPPQPLQQPQEPLQRQSTVPPPFWQMARPPPPPSAQHWAPQQWATPPPWAPQPPWAQQQMLPPYHYPAPAPPSTGWAMGPPMQPQPAQLHHAAWGPSPPPAFAPPPPWEQLLPFPAAPTSPPWLHHPAPPGGAMPLPPLPPLAPQPPHHPWGPPRLAHVFSSGGADDAPAITVMPPNRPFVGPVFETSSVLTASTSRPPTAKPTVLPPLPGATAGACSASFLPQRDEPAREAMPGRSTLVIPAQAEGAASRQEQGTAGRPSQQGGARSIAPGSRCPSGLQQQWSGLQDHCVPFSRQSSPTPPSLSQPEEAPQGARRGSWAGMQRRLSHWPI